MSHLEEHQMLLKKEKRSSDTPFFDNTIEIARRSMESKALLMSNKMMVVIRLDTRHMSNM